MIRSDARFDPAVAREAAAECERAARLLRETTGRRHHLAVDAVTNGRGPWRDDVMRRIAGNDQRSADLERRLRALASALHDVAERPPVD